MQNVWKIILKLHYRNVNTNLCWVNFCTYRNVSSLLECSLIDLFQNNSHLKTIHLSDEFHRHKVVPNLSPSL